MSGPRVLVVRLSALGDVLLSLPALRRLRRAVPEARVDWLVEAPHAPVLEGNPDLDRVHVLRTRAWRSGLLRRATWREMGDVFAALRAERYDLTLDLQGLLKSAFAARLAGAPIRVGLAPGRARERAAALFANRLAGDAEGGHVVDLGLAAADEAARALGREPARPDPALDETRLVHLTDAERNAAAEVLSSRGLERFVVVNPGAAWVTKRWSAPGFGELAQAIAVAGPSVFVAHGPGEESLAGEVVRHAAHARVVTFPTRIRELAALLERAELFVGGDTGPYHLARAMGTPTVGLFGPTDPGRNGPRGSGDAALWGKPSCSPCYGRTCPTHIECMAALRSDQVRSAVLARLAGEAGGRRVKVLLP